MKFCYNMKLDNIEEMDKLLDSYNRQRLNQEEIEHPKKPITIKKIETAIKSPPHPKQNPRPRRVHYWVLTNL